VIKRQDEPSEASVKIGWWFNAPHLMEIVNLEAFALAEHAWRGCKSENAFETEPKLAGLAVIIVTRAFLEERDAFHMLFAEFDFRIVLDYETIRLQPKSDFGCLMVVSVLQ
jgi:hypothetical protein